MVRLESLEDELVEVFRMVKWGMAYAVHGVVVVGSGV